MAHHLTLNDSLEHEDQENQTDKQDDDDWLLIQVVTNEEYHGVDTLDLTRILASV